MVLPIKNFIKKLMGLDTSFLLLNLFLDGTFKVKSIYQSSLLPGSTVYDRYTSLKLVTDSLAFYSALYTVIASVIGVIAQMLGIRILFNIIFILISCTSVVVMAIALYLIIITVIPQLKYLRLIKQGQGEEIIDTYNLNIYNRDYIIGLVVLGIPSAIVFITLILSLPN